VSGPGARARAVRTSVRPEGRVSYVHRAIRSRTSPAARPPAESEELGGSAVHAQRTGVPRGRSRRLAARDALRRAAMGTARSTPRRYRTAGSPKDRHDPLVRVAATAGNRRPAGSTSAQGGRRTCSTGSRSSRSAALRDEIVTATVHSGARSGCRRQPAVTRAGTLEIEASRRRIRS